MGITESPVQRVSQGFLDLKIQVNKVQMSTFFCLGMRQILAMQELASAIMWDLEPSIEF